MWIKVNVKEISNVNEFPAEARRLASRLRAADENKAAAYYNRHTECGPLAPLDAAKRQDYETHTDVVGFLGDWTEALGVEVRPWVEYSDRAFSHNLALCENLASCVEEAIARG